MKYEDITLNHLFREQNWSDEKLSEIEMKDKFAELKQEINNSEPRLKWEKVFGEIKESCSNLLNVKLGDVLESAWGKYKEVEQYLGEENYKTDETILIPLVEHTVTSVHQPKIEIRLGEIYVGKIDFNVNLKLILSGIILKINYGKIQGVKAGKCKSKGTFACEGITLFEDESSEFEF